MKVNKNVVKKIFLFFSTFIFLWLFYYFVFFIPAYEALTIRKYTQNKIAVILVFVEDFKKNYGHPPDQLNQIKEKINDYLLNNPDFSDRYLFASWTNKTVPLFMMPAAGIGYTIKCNELQYIRDGEDYYMYFWSEDRKNKNLSLEQIKEIISKYGDFCTKYSGLVIVHNGKIIFGMISKNNEPFTLDNIKNYLWVAERHKALVWYLFEK